ncbi:MAG: AzlD domain-containing protein [Alphaproteobacteria bacterium]|nr:AzlD domain-containing protein [Alphaproteobacteria bacterium]
MDTELLGGLWGGPWGGLWGVILASGLLTFAARFSMIGIFHDRELPELIKRLLAYVAPAALSAIILPDILLVEGDITFTGNAQIPAFILAAVVAYFSRNVMATITTGMIALWVIESLF